MMRIIGVSLILTQVLILVESVPPSDKSVVKQDVNGSCDCGLIKNPYLEVLRGRDGRDGIPGRDGMKGEKGERGNRGNNGATGPPGPPAPNNGGVVYTRWGKTTCPNTGAELVYEGIAGGTSWDQPGGGANYLCLPKVPQYLSTVSPNWFSLLHGSEYETNNVIFSKQNHNVPCAVCYTSKETKLMIPAKTTCPTSWTREYYGYLMTNHDSHKSNVVYECVDSNPESIPGSSPNTNGAVFNFIKGTCNGLPCPPYINNRAITCVVCTK